MSASPAVTVVIPCYNYGRHLAEAIESALAQTHGAIEVIVVDDGSTDETATVAARFAPQVHCIRQVHGGASAARNTGLAVARGDYVLFLDADDVLEPDYVERTLQVFTASGDERLAFVYTTMRLFGRESGVTVAPEFDLDELLVGNYVHATALLRTDAARQAGYDTRLRQWEDWDFYLALCERGWTGRLVDAPLLRYRKHGDRNSLIDQLRVRQQRRIYATLAWKHRALYRRRRALMWRRIAVGRCLVPLQSAAERVLRSGRRAGGRTAIA